MANLYDNSTNNYYSPQEPDEISLFLQQILLRSSSSSSNSLPWQPSLVPVSDHAAAEQVLGQISTTEHSSALNSCSTCGFTDVSPSSVGNLENETDDCDYESEEAGEVLLAETAPKSSLTRGSTKRTRAAEVHNLSEKRRRSRINEKMKALQNLIPNSNKTDKASMLDEAIDYLKQLQLQVQMLTMRNGLSLYPICLPGMLQSNQVSQTKVDVYGTDNVLDSKVVKDISIDQNISNNSLLTLPGNCVKQEPAPEFLSMLGSKTSLEVDLSMQQQHFGAFQLSRSFKVKEGESVATLTFVQGSPSKEKELSELFETVKRAADEAENSPGEEDRCLDLLKQLKKFPVNYQVLVSTQVGKRLRQLTKHRSGKIKALASDVIEIWKSIIVKETMKNKKTGSGENSDSMKTESPRSEANGVKNFQRTNSMMSDQNSGPTKKLKVDNSDKSIKSGTSSSVKIEKVEVQKIKIVTAEVKVEKVSSGARKPPDTSPSLPKVSSLVYCKDPDKVREILAEALCKVSSEVQDDDLKHRVNKHDPYRVAVQVESTMFEKWGKSNGANKFKYRSVMFNIKDQNNPDFRRKVLIGEFETLEVLELTPEQMASDARQVQNEKIKEKMMSNSERAAAPKASTNEFTCGRCKKKETTYYQMQTRSADEPMTTFVTCVNCGNHWKFC